MVFHLHPDLCTYSIERTIDKKHEVMYLSKITWGVKAGAPDFFSSHETGPKQTCLQSFCFLSSGRGRGGVKVFWNFTKNSSVLVASPVALWKQENPQQFVQFHPKVTIPWIFRRKGTSVTVAINWVNRCSQHLPILTNYKTLILCIFCKPPVPSAVHCSTGGPLDSWLTTRDIM